MKESKRKNNRIVCCWVSMILAVVMVVSSALPICALDEADAGSDAGNYSDYDANNSNDISSPADSDADNTDNNGIYVEPLESTPTEPGDEPSGEEDPDEPPIHVHQWGAWKTVRAATYLKSGLKRRYCQICNQKQTQTIKKKVAYNKWVKVDGKRYYLNSSGKPTTKWTLLYTNNKKSGYKRWCYFTKSGVFKKSFSRKTKKTWVYVNGGKFYFTSKCKPAGKGFHKIKGYMYYMNSRKAVVIGTVTDKDGNKYKTNKNGAISMLQYYKQKYKNFILVDISDQKLRLYRHKKCTLSTNVVTGNKGKNDTPCGTYKLGTKSRNIWLVGPTWRRQVSYWMPFIGGSFGFHDASWRPASDYNSSTYKWNGSHGCVNLQTAPARYLYGHTYTGMTVIIKK